MPEDHVDIATLRRQLDIPRDRAAKLGLETVTILEQGGYEDRQGNWVDLAEAVEAARNGTIEYVPDDPIPAPCGPLSGGAPRVTVRNATTLAAARYLLDAGLLPAALNFAAPAHPGGGFMSGARAQEEYLARSSALSVCLAGRQMYTYCAGRKDPFAADFVIVSPRVPVFRNDEGGLIDSPWPCTIITSPAVHAYGVHRYMRERSGEIEAVMRRRVRRVLRAAAAHVLRNIVLGAWGCGAFGNDPAMVARLFAEALESALGRQFDQVVFSVTDWSADQRFIAPFHQVFEAWSCQPRPSDA